MHTGWISGECGCACVCSIGRIPANVIMTRNAIPEMDKLRIIARLETAGMVPRWRAALYEGGNNPNDFLLTSGYGLCIICRETISAKRPIVQ